MEHVRGRVRELSKTQFGSRFLQDRLGPEQDSAYAALLFAECHAHLPELMSNLFASYLCQRLFEFGTSLQRCALLQRLSGDFLSVACDRQGSVRDRAIIE